MLLGRALAGHQIRNETDPFLTVTSTEGWDLFPTTSGERVNPQTAVKLGAVYGCAVLISGSMSNLPVKVHQRLPDNNRQMDVSHPVNDLLNLRPNDRMTAATMKRLWELQRLLNGNSYTYIRFAKAGARAGQPIELIPLPVDTIPYVADDGSLWYVSNVPGLGYRKFRSDEILHFKGDMTYDGITGMSVLTAAAESIGSDLSAQKYAGKFYKQGARPSGVLEVPGKLEQPLKDKLRGQFESMVAGMDNAYRVAVLDIGMKYTQMSLSQRDSQFIESRNFAKEDIATFFRVPLYKLNSGKQAYQSNEQNAIEYVIGTLQPNVTQYEQELTYKLLMDSEIGKNKYIRYNMAAELRGDNKSRAEFYEKMIQLGIYTQNDCLAFEDMPTFVDGGRHYMSLNYVPIEYIEDYQRARAGGSQKGGSE